MAASRACTPPPPDHLHVPHAPRHGAMLDSWEPYSPPRKSARLSARHADTCTPSPQSKPVAKRITVARSPRAAKNSIAAARNSIIPPASNAMFSPAPSPQKKRVTITEPIASSDHSPHLFDQHSAASGLDPDLVLDSPPPRSSQAAGGRETVVGPAMLPTPAKTPRTRTSDKKAANIQRVARSLFHSDDETVLSPSPRPRNKRYAGVGLDSLMAADDSDEIEIYTDSRERVPEKDDSAENPFYGGSFRAKPSKKKRRQAKVMIPGEGVVDMEEAVKRDDGFVYNFRGKIFFRFIAKDEDGNTEVEGEEGTPRRSTRLRNIGRVLFPAAKSVPENQDEDEEEASTEYEDEDAATDVEDHQAGAAGAPVKAPLKDVPDVPATPVARKMTAAPLTPDAPKFGLSPPATKRITRSMKPVDDDEAAHASSDQQSPLWSAAKQSGRTGPSSPTRTTARKRTGGHLPAEPAKRARV